jgi:hypothetical protein
MNTTELSIKNSEVIESLFEKPRLFIIGSAVELTTSGAKKYPDNGTGFTMRL